MHTLIITFQLADLDDATYRQQTEAVAPMFTQVPGLIGKTWLADRETNTYGGVYFFEDGVSLRGYLDSEIVRGLRANPHFANVAIRTFGAIEPATRMTRGAWSTAAVLQSVDQSATGFRIGGW